MKALKLTPNLVVRDVTASLNFYRNVLGFECAFSVPDAPPYVFAACGGGRDRLRAQGRVDGDVLGGMVVVDSPLVENPSPFGYCRPSACTTISWVLGS